jgi:hypothetical protein
MALAPNWLRRRNMATPEQHGQSAAVIRFEWRIVFASLLEWRGNAN